VAFIQTHVLKRLVIDMRDASGRYTSKDCYADRISRFPIVAFYLIGLIGSLSSFASPHSLIYSSLFVP